MFLKLILQKQQLFQALMYMVSVRCFLCFNISLVTKLLARVRMNHF